jgi:enoyl-CoA hydratase/carnithine racemase
MRYVLTGDTLSGQEAYRLGLVQELVEPGQQFDRALAIAESIAKAAPMGVQASLASARQARDYGNRVAMQRIPEFMPAIIKSNDSREGMMAFMERREPNFSGD